MPRNEMKAEKLFRNVPANIHELYLALAGLPKDMKVKAEPETGVSEKTVGELRARTTWPPGLVVTSPRELYRRKSFVKISKPSLEEKNQDLDTLLLKLKKMQEENEKKKNGSLNQIKPSARYTGGGVYETPVRGRHIQWQSRAHNQQKKQSLSPACASTFMMDCNTLCDGKRTAEDSLDRSPALPMRLSAWGPTPPPPTPK